MRSGDAVQWRAVLHLSVQTLNGFAPGLCTRFFFQAEDGIRDADVTGVQTCALPIFTVTGNEIVIAGLQKDGMRATDLAQAGIQEAIARVASGRPYTAVGGWTSSIDPRVTVTVTRVFPGANSAYLQIDSVASNIGKATRRLTALVLQQVIAFPPNVTFAYSVTEQGSADISCGDAYSQTFLRFKNYPSNSCGGQPRLPHTGSRGRNKTTACHHPS